MNGRNALMTAEPTPAAGDGVDELRRQVEALRLENAVMRETINVLKADDPRLDPSVPANRERTRVVDAIGSEFGLKAVLDAVGLKRSTYYYERGVIAAGDGYAALRARVADLFEDGGRVRGLPDHPPHAASRRDGSARRLGEGSAPDHARGGTAASVPETSEAVELL